MKAAELLANHEVVALPSETVYGLAGNAFSADAVAKIFKAKDRPTFDPLIVHVADSKLEVLVAKKIISEQVLSWPSASLINQALKKFWPGPLTLVLPRGSAIPDAVTSGQNTVGVRMPAHALFLELLGKLSFPLAAPSANRFGRISPTQAAHVVAELDGRIAAVLDGGPCSVGVESTIIQINDPLEIKLLRPGKIGIEELENHFRVKISVHAGLGETQQKILAPGLLESHYSPRKPLILIPHSFKERNAVLNFLKSYPLDEKYGVMGMSETPSNLPFQKIEVREVLSEKNSLAEMANRLFATLRDLDENPEVETILVDLPVGDSPLVSALRDRLRRASRNKPVI